jgi:hypothetical protein
MKQDEPRNHTKTMKKTLAPEWFVYVGGNDSGLGALKYRYSADLAAAAFNEQK